MLVNSTPEKIMEHTNPNTKKKSHQQGAKTASELINLRFYENQKRQALTTTVEEEDDERNDDVLSSVKTTQVCDTVDTLKNPIPPPSSEKPVDNFPSASSLAISAPSDKSRKGSVDKKIWNLVNLINKERDSFFTTSSCSGRIILYTWDTADGEETQVSAATSLSKLKKGCKWLLVSHDEVQPEELVNAYSTTATTADTKAPTGERDVYFKMEPCILHVQCRTLSNARKLIHIATESGFRNSGMVIGKENRITVAIRSAMGLEVPLPLPQTADQTSEPPENSTTRISEEYLKYLAATANAKMRENWSRSDKLTAMFAETTWNV